MLFSCASQRNTPTRRSLQRTATSTAKEYNHYTSSHEISITDDYPPAPSPDNHIKSLRSKKCVGEKPNQSSLHTKILLCPLAYLHPLAMTNPYSTTALWKASHVSERNRNNRTCHHRRNTSRKITVTILFAHDANLRPCRLIDLHIQNTSPTFIDAIQHSVTAAYRSASIAVISPNYIHFL